MNRIIIVKDYLYDDNYVIGYPYYDKEVPEDSYILEDGDIYTIGQLKESDYEVVVVEPKEIIKAFKKKFEVTK